MAPRGDKQRYTKLISDLDHGLANRKVERPRFSGEEPPKKRIKKYPDYDIRYTLAVHRYNCEQLMVLEGKVKKIADELRRRESPRLMGFLKFYLNEILAIRKCQRQISRITGCRS